MPKDSNILFWTREELRAEIERLKAEVERLIKAGDEVIHEWSSGHGTDVENFTKALWVWAVAKEGKPRTESLEAENARLKAEVERLRKAGDWMREALEEGPIDYQCRIDRWNAAKKGKQS